MCKSGQLDDALQALDLMHRQGKPLSRCLVYPFIDGCSKEKKVDAVKCVHSLLVGNRLDSIAFLVDHLIRLFALAGRLLEANLAFCKVQKPSVYTWHAIISAHVTYNENDRALELYAKMKQDDVAPNKFVYMSVLGACGKIGALEHGKLIHKEIIKSELESDAVVGNTLIDMYAKVGGLEEAHKVFDGHPKQDIVSWGAIIGGYAQHGHGLPALELFEKMQNKGTKPNKVIFLCILRACASVEATWLGKLIHDDIIRSGLESDPAVGCVIIDMYAKCASLKEAQKVFDNLASQNVVSWCALIGGYIQYGHDLSALELFGKMQQEGTMPNAFIFSSILKACGSTGDLGRAKLIHDHIIRSGVYLDDIVGNTLVDMYCQCGDLDMARKVFDNLANQNLMSWGTMIFGYVQHGHIHQVLDFFKEMQWHGVKPNVVTFSCILKACGSIGAIEKGKLVHQQMMRSGLQLDSIVGSILIDMYAMCGFLDEAQRVFDKLPIRNAVSWAVLIAGYAEHGDSKLAGQCLENMLEQGFKPDGKVYTSILVACTHAGKIEEGRHHFKSMVEDHGIVPSVEHSNCMADLLGRAGHLVEAEKLLLSMPMSVDITGWMSLLSACRIYGNVDIGRQCFNQVVSLDPSAATVYILMSSIYADAQMWEKVYQIRELRKCAGVWKTAGKACFDDTDYMDEFVGGDKTHPQSDWIGGKVKKLLRLMNVEGYFPLVDLVSGSMFVNDEGLCPS